MEVRDDKVELLHANTDGRSDSIEIIELDERFDLAVDPLDYFSDGCCHNTPCSSC